MGEGVGLAGRAFVSRSPAANRVATPDLQRSERLDSPHGYAEFASTVSAINGLVSRRQSQALAEQAFASDVAHELRTPLAATAFQAGVAVQHPDAPAFARRRRRS